MTNLSHQATQDPLVPKQEILDFGDNVASSSGGNVTSTLIGMGFQPSLVYRVIQEKGQEDFDLLLDTLVAFTEGSQRSDSESSDSLDCLFDDKGINTPEISTFIQPKEEPDKTDEVDDSKRASLLLMNFSPEEVNFAMNRLGEDAPIDGLVDFIVAAQIAKRLETVTEDIDDDDKEKNEDISNEILFGTMDKTLHLLEMGFSETQVSWAIEKCGSELPISELADSIFTGRTPTKKSIATTTNCTSFSLGMEGLHNDSLIGSVKAEIEGLYSDTAPQQMNIDTSFLGKRPKQEHANDSFETAENCKGKRPKPDYTDDSDLFPDPSYFEEKFDPELHQCGMPEPMNIKPRKPLTGTVARPPYFLYGNVENVSHEYWVKISKFLYNLEPEFANTRYFSALCRKEGYVHNLPTEERFVIDPKPPMTIEDAMPHTKKWWPSWDARKQLKCISSEVNGISQLCERLGRTLINSHGLLSIEQRRNILHHCESQNLVWVGKNKLGAIDPEYLEIILGYPLNHTSAYTSLIERLQSVKYCFQTDTLGYHLSVLKSMYPGGLTVLSIFGGIGGAEIALHRLGIHLKAVVSVESSETKRAVLKKWWQNSRQTGELVQIEGIQKLTSSRLMSLMGKFGCFDLVICQNPCSHPQSWKDAADGSSITGFDLSLFCEFVRILQRVRGMVDQRR